MTKDRYSISPETQFRNGTPGRLVKQGALVSTPYNTINFLGTIGEVLGLPPMNLNDALAKPMADIFNTTPSPWSFTATPSALLYSTQLPLPPKPTGLFVPKPTHSARYWARVSKDMDFTDADRVDADDFNTVLRKGMMGKKAYPKAPTGLDLRENRSELRARYQRSLTTKNAQEANKGANQARVSLRVRPERRPRYTASTEPKALISKAAARFKPAGTLTASRLSAPTEKARSLYAECVESGGRGRSNRVYRVPVDQPFPRVRMAARRSSPAMAPAPGYTEGTWRTKRLGWWCTQSAPRAYCIN